MDVKSSVTVGKDVEALSESELLASVHAEISSHKHDNAALNGSFLDIGVHIGVLDFVERKGFNFIGNFFETFMACSGVGHLTVVLVEVDEGLSLLAVELHRLVVFLEEHVGHLLGIHLTAILI